MQIENDYDKEVYNGDIGLVADVDPDAGELTARFEGRDLLYGFGELDTLVPAYAATVHKSQGSEYLAVVIPVLTQHYAMLRRNLLYTGVTRGKRLVVLVGQKKAVAIAVRNASGCRRWSKLDEWLAGGGGRSASRSRPRCPGSSGAAVDGRHALRVIGEQDGIGCWGRRTDEQGRDGRSPGSPNGPEQGDRQGSGGRCVRSHRRRSCQWRRGPDYGIGHLRHEKQTGPYRPQPRDRRGRIHIGVDIADIQGREDAERCREGGSRVMTLQRQPNATRSAADRLNVESTRLLCHDGHTAICQAGAGKSQDRRRVDGWTAAGLDAASCMRQEGRGLVST